MLVVERIISAAIGLLVGGVLGSFVGFVPPLAEFGSVFSLAGALGGAIYGAMRPVAAGAAMPTTADWHPGPAPIGALAMASVSEMRRGTTIALGIGMVLGIAAIPAALAAYLVAGARPSLTILGLVGVLGFVAAIACMAVLPAFLVDARTRAATAAMTWLGSREFARAFGSRLAADGFPTTPAAAAAWLSRHPETDANREALVEVRLMAGDFDGARETLDRVPRETARDRFVHALMGEMIRYQQSGVADDAAAESAANAMTDDMERTEALVGLATFRARRLLPDGDWRAPLVASAALLPEPEWRVLLRDTGMVAFAFLVKRLWLVIASLLVLTLVLGLQVDARLD